MRVFGVAVHQVTPKLVSASDRAEIPGFEVLPGKTQFLLGLFAVGFGFHWVCFPWGLFAIGIVFVGFLHCHRQLPALLGCWAVLEPPFDFI